MALLRRVRSVAYLVVVAMVMIVPDRRSEFAVELLLLLGRQQRPNLVVGLKDELLMLMRENPRAAAAF